MRDTKLKTLNACSDACGWVATQKNYKEAWQNCERGDWMLWLAKKLNVDDRKLTMAKAMCAKQVEHLMKDQRSKDAIQACIDCFNGLISKERFNAAAYAAAYAADDVMASTAYAATAAAHAAAAGDGAYDAAVAGAAAAIAADAAYIAAVDVGVTDTDADAARLNSLKRSADICREYLTEDVLTAYRKIRRKTRSLRTRTP